MIAVFPQLNRQACDLLLSGARLAAIIAQMSQRRFNIGGLVVGRHVFSTSISKDALGRMFARRDFVKNCQTAKARSQLPVSGSQHVFLLKAQPHAVRPALYGLVRILDRHIVHELGAVA